MEKQNLCIQAFSFAPFFYNTTLYFYLIISSFEKKKVSIYYCIVWYTFLYFLTIRKQKQRINKTINAKKKHNITCSCCHSLKRLFNFWTILAIATVGATINTNTNNKNNSRRKRITISEKYKQILWIQKIGLKSFSN